MTALMINEADRRNKLIESETKRLKLISSGILLTGSMAYGPNTSIHKNSDIDLIIIVEDLKEVTHNFITNDILTAALNKRYFDGYCIKRSIEHINISYHIFNSDTFDIITKCFVADIRVFRESPKRGNYILKGFEGNTYNYEIKNIVLPDLNGGVRTIVPISFIFEDRYYVGIHREKILSCSKILFDPNDILENGIESVWKKVITNLIDESIRVYGQINLEKVNILNTLVRKEKLGDECITEILDKTQFHFDHY